MILKDSCSYDTKLNALERQRQDALKNPAFGLDITVEGNYKILGKCYTNVKFFIKTLVKRSKFLFHFQNPQNRNWKSCIKIFFFFWQERQKKPKQNKKPHHCK